MSKSIDARSVLLLLFAGALVFLLSDSLRAEDEAGPIRADYSLDQVSESVYVIHGSAGLPSPANQGLINNPAFVLTSAGVVVIDPGSSVQIGRMVLDKLQSVSLSPVVAIFSTHIHGDHWLGNQAIKERYPDAVSYAHPTLIEQANAGQGQFWVDLMYQMTEGATGGTRAVIPDHSVSDGETISIGETDFTIIHQGKAHTETDIAILVQPENVLFTGDTVFNHQLALMDDGHFEGSIGMLDYLIQLEPRVVVPGHGDTGDISVINNMRRFHETLYQAVETQFEAGLTDFEMKEAVIEQLEEFVDWDGFDTGIGRIISLIYLEIEEANF